MSRARRLAIALGVGLALAGCGGEGSDGPRQESGQPRLGTNVYVISLDAASARYVEPYGAGPGSTPHIQRFAEQAVVFDAAYSQTATTASSVASLLTGVRATTHRVEPLTMRPLQLPTLAERLREHGYRGFGFVANPMADLPGRGFERGYAVYEQVYIGDGLLAGNPSYEGTRYKLVYPEDMNRSLARVIDELEATHAFAYLHYLQPHAPYDPPPPHREHFDGWRGPRAALDWDQANAALIDAHRNGEADPETVALLEARYRANLHYADAGFGALLDALRNADRFDDALIVLTADHGEAFWGHGRFGHNWTLYDDMVHVPLIVRFPTRSGIGARRIAVPTETVDLLPTILDYLGLPIPEEAEGVSLWPLIDGRPEAFHKTEVVLSTAWLDLHAIRAGPWKLILNDDGRPELYDLARDPDERHDLSHEERETVVALSRRLASLVDSGSDESIAQEPRAELDPEMVDLLEKLGYGDASPDPRD